MEGASVNFTFENHPVIATLRMKGIPRRKKQYKAGENPDAAEKEKYSEQQLHQIYNKLELSSSMVAAFKEVSYYRHFDQARLQKLIQLQVNHPPEILQAIPYYILHAAISYCFQLEEAYNDSDLVLVLKSLIYLSRHSQLATADNMIYFLIRFASYNALAIDTKSVLEIIQIFINTKRKADPKLFSALVYWTSNNRSAPIVQSCSEQVLSSSVKIESANIDTDTMILLSFIDEMLKIYPDSITSEDATLLFSRIEKVLKKLQPFGISMFSTIQQYLPQEILDNFYKGIPQDIVNYIHTKGYKYPKIDLSLFPECVKINTPRFPSICHNFHENVDFSIKELEKFTFPTTELNPQLKIYSKLICENNSKAVGEALTESLPKLAQKKIFLDAVECYVQLFKNDEPFKYFLNELLKTQVFDPKITIFSPKNDAVDAVIKVRNLIYANLFDNGSVILSDFARNFVGYPDMAAEFFIRMTSALENHQMSSIHFLVLQSIALLFIPSYQDAHSKATDPEIRLSIERARLAMVNFFVLSMKNCECFDVYTTTDFLSLFFSLVYEDFFSDVVIDSVFEHFKNPNDEFLQQITTVLSFSITSGENYTDKRYVNLTLKIFRRLVEIDAFETSCMGELKEKLMTVIRLSSNEFPPEFIILSIKFLTLMSSYFPITAADANILSKAISITFEDEPSPLVHMELVNLLAGKQLLALSPDFLIKQPSALPIFITAFKKSSRLMGNLQFIEQLCIFSSTNARQCQKGKLDIALLDLIQENPSDKKTVKLSLNLIGLIASVSSSRTAVQKFISMFCPIDSKYVNPLLDDAVDEMSTILSNGHNIPSGYLPVTNKEPYISITGLKSSDFMHGFSAGFWTFVDSGSSRSLTSLFSLSDKNSKIIDVSVENFGIVVQLGNQIQTFPNCLNSDIWVFFALTFENLSKGLQTVVKLYVENRQLEQTFDESFEIENGQMICNCGYPFEPRQKNEHPVLLGPFFLSPPLQWKQFYSIDTIGTHGTFDLAFFSVHPEVENSLLNLRTKKDYSSRAKIIGPEILQTPTFQDIFLRSYQVTSLIPLFAQANLSDSVRVLPIVRLIKKVLEISNEAQADFEKYGRFSIIAYLLKSFDIDIYQEFYQVFVKLQNKQIGQKLSTEILMNIKLLSLAPPDSQIGISEHWLNIILPSIKETLKKKSELRIYLLPFVEYFHKITPKARMNVIKSLVFRAECQFTHEAFLELIMQTIQSKDEEINYELLLLIYNIACSDKQPFNQIGDITHLTTIHSLLLKKSVRISILLLDTIFVLVQTNVFRNQLLIYLEVYKNFLPVDIMNEELLTGIMTRCVDQPDYLSICCYIMAMNPSLEQTFVYLIPKKIDNYLHANKAWPLWPFIAAVNCKKSASIEKIFEFVLEASPKNWITDYVLLEIAVRLCQTMNTKYQTIFFNVMGQYLKKFPENVTVFENLCFVFIFTRREQTHNSALLSVISKCPLNLVDKSNLVLPQLNVKFEPDKFIQFLTKFEIYKPFTYGLNFNEKNLWEDISLAMILNEFTSSQNLEKLISLLNNRQKNIDYTGPVELVMKQYEDFVNSVSVEFSRLCSFISKFLKKAQEKTLKFSRIHLPKIPEIISSNLLVSQQWKTLWTQLTIESAPWASSIQQPAIKHYNLDPVLCYGYCPMRMKENKHFNDHRDASLSRDYGSALTAKSKIDEYMKQLQEKYEKESPPEILQVLSHRDSALSSDSGPVLLRYKGTLVKLTYECPCELIIVEGGLRIDVEGENKQKTISIRSNSVKKVYFRPYLHHPTGLEIYCHDGKSYLLNMTVNSMSILKKMASFDGWQKTMIQTIPSINMIATNGVTEKWVQGKKSNFSYLMYLNRISGRTFNDSSLYPIMPWILSDYESSKLDLDNEKNYRDLSKPIGALGESRLKEIIERQKSLTEFGLINYMYSSCYSSPLTVFMWLMRMEPFTTLHTQLQSGKFDHAARLFISVGDTWKMVTSHMNDFRELIPEFYYLPQFLVNENHFDLGKVNGKEVNDVKLPNWAKSPLDFVYKMRQALESDFVSRNLNKWIDLIWGVNSCGEGAEKSLNTFDPNMYESAWNNETLNDPGKRSLIEATMKHCGQIPQQLFNIQHPSKSATYELRREIIYDTKIDPFAAVSVVRKAFIFTQHGQILCHDGGEYNAVEVSSLSFHPSDDSSLPMVTFGKSIAIAAPLGYIEIFDTEKNESKKVFAHTGKATCIDSSTRLVCSGGSDSTLYLFDHSMQNSGNIPFFREEVVDCSICDAFHLAAAITRDGCLFAVDTTRVIVKFSLTVESPRHVVVTPAWGFVVVVSTTPDDTTDSVAVYTCNGELVTQAKTARISMIKAVKDRKGFDYLVWSDERGGIRVVEAYHAERMSETRPIKMLGSLISLHDMNNKEIVAVTKHGVVAYLPVDYLTH
ncbi:Beige/BEACH domain containing protein [Trichomonas vaginalis G3]|uniref:Beige/BEACH domain containing protein n=1 Tax=Trichomonas vaginalis (strain ATCC PRA-98 / G3) TaxID=412133 RepID=A2E2Z4_TRIV3|nr:beige/BEACH-related family [Trichomonas vaginalis G3]EAY12930.1 Beige/BEACH domain containing protein [Trichomonas vaginalis G3]KAI5499734.1 beige/BEACH-related family [Trichomonas vaginalis G3]|eukprot:XP_001325153.1 Beige/BEACH domain containing protein [Trichomonas vaginalis G3]